MPRSLLALDLALNAGYAFWKDGDAKPDAGLLPIDPKWSRGKRLASYYKWLLRVTRENGVTDIALEAPIAGGGKEGKIFWLISICGVTEMLGAQCRIDVKTIKNSDWFPHWCGTNNISGDQRKTYSVLEAQRRGFPGLQQKDHDIADALGCLSYRCRELNLKTPWDSQRSPGPLFTAAGAGHKTPQGVRITKDNERRAAIITNRVLNKGEK